MQAIFIGRGTRERQIEIEDGELVLILERLSKRRPLLAQTQTYHRVPLQDANRYLYLSEMGSCRLGPQLLINDEVKPTIETGIRSGCVNPPRIRDIKIGRLYVGVEEIVEYCNTHDYQVHSHWISQISKDSPLSFVLRKARNITYLE